MTDNNSIQLALTNTSHLQLRRNLGILGISMPIILFTGNGFELRSSISHFYYSDMIVVFTGILCAFGLFLFSYRGYEKDKETISDNLLTTIAGVFAISTALIPTGCSELDCVAPNGHSDGVRSTIHLVSAAGFLTIMGWMAFFRFTKSKSPDLSPIKKKRNRFYKISAIAVWGSLALVGIGFATNTDLTGYDVFIGETIALFFFGAAWLVKGKTLENWGL